MMQLSGCVSTSYTDSDGVEQVYHGLILQLDKSVEKIKNIHYKYGVLETDSGIEEKTYSPGSFVNDTLFMPVPDYFEISWETLDGISHQAKVPVKGHLPASVKNKTVAFVIMYDSVQGYLERYTPTGIEKTRFY